MQNFIFQNPVKIVFGKHLTKDIGKHAKTHGTNALLLYGKGSVNKNGILDNVKESLNTNGIRFVECGGVKSNPVISHVREAIKIFKANKLDSIIAVGGGSVIDSAKTIAAGVYTENDPWDFFIGKAKAEKAVPISTVLTLAATASEMNSGAVITNEETKQKFSFNFPVLFPKVSILDPMNTMSVPKDYTMYGAIDAIIHLLEGYFTTQDRIESTSVQNHYIEGLIKSIMESANTLNNNLADYDSRASLMWSASLALNGLGSAGLGPIGFPMHMIEHSLSALYDVPHGAGLAVISIGWMKYYKEQRPEKFVRFAKNIFSIEEKNHSNEQETICIGIDKLEDWYKSLSSPTRLTDFKIPKNDISMIAKNAVSLAERWGMREYTEEEIEKVLTLCL